MPCRQYLTVYGIGQGIALGVRAAKIDSDNTTVLWPTAANRNDLRSCLTGRAHTIVVGVQLVIFIGAILGVDTVINIVFDAIKIGIGNGDHFFGLHRHGLVHGYRGTEALRFAVEHLGNITHRCGGAGNNQIGNRHRIHINTRKFRQIVLTLLAVNHAITEVQRHGRQHIGSRVAFLRGVGGRIVQHRRNRLYRQTVGRHLGLFFRGIGVVVQYRRSGKNVHRLIEAKAQRGLHSILGVAEILLQGFRGGALAGRHFGGQRGQRCGHHRGTAIEHVGSNHGFHDGDHRFNACGQIHRVIIRFHHHDIGSPRGIQTQASDLRLGIGSASTHRCGGANQIRR